MGSDLITNTEIRLLPPVICYTQMFGLAQCVTDQSCLGAMGLQSTNIKVFSQVSEQ